MHNENPEFLKTQIITYLGNKRTLIGNIEKEIEFIKAEMKKTSLCCADLFSGSGIVSHMLKKHSHTLILNDIENYSVLLNACYLNNKNNYPKKLCDDYRLFIKNECENKKIEGVITQNYAPKTMK